MNFCSISVQSGDKSTADPLGHGLNSSKACRTNQRWRGTKKSHLLMVRRMHSTLQKGAVEPNDWCWVNTNLALEDLDSAMERLSLSIVSQENSAAANSVDPHEYTLTHSTLEEASSEHGNRNVMNNYNNGAIVQGALLTSSHDYNGFTSTEQETHDVEESVAQRLRGIRGHMVTLAMDQWGCRFLQAIIDNGIPQEIDMILDEVEDHTHELMTHHFGNYLIEKFFTSGKLTFYQFQRILLCVDQAESCRLVEVAEGGVRSLELEGENGEAPLQATAEDGVRTCLRSGSEAVVVVVGSLEVVVVPLLFFLVSSPLLFVAGTRVAQKMLTSLRDPVHIAYTIRRLMYITVPLLKNANGGYVIQQCVRVFTESCQKVIFDEIARNCVDVATDKNGCSVIQKCMAHSAGVPILLLVKSIIINSEILSADPFGNYVVQYIIKRNILEPPVTKMIILHLRGHYAELSMNRHASHVIEVLFRHSEPTDVDIIIMELVNSPDFVSVLRHPYGNYVAQRALQFSTGVTNRTLVHRILSNYAYLHAHPYGKRVLTYIKGIRRGG
ncbi:hypothetical protein HN51_056853 [Arachis hypogaea]